MPSSRTSAEARGPALIATDVTVHHGTDGRVRANHAAAEYAAWAPYVEAFGSITLVARYEPEPSVPDEGPLVDGPGVGVQFVPRYKGLGGLLRQMPALVRAFCRLGDRRQVFVGRLPEPLSILLFCRSLWLKVPFVSVVVAEPFTLVLSSEAIPHWISRAAGRSLRFVVRQIVARSAAVIYVSEAWLQDLYPANSGTPTLARSNVRLSEIDFAEPRGEAPVEQRTIRLVTMGSMSTATKGNDFLIRVAAALQHREHLNPQLTLIGDGPLRGDLMRLATESGVATTFVGQVHDREEIRRLLDASDVYVSGSRSEGLSRAMVEGMARGLPVVSTRAGAVAELIEPEYIVDVDNLDAFVAAVLQVTAEGTYQRQSERNLRRAREVADLANEDLLSEFLERAL